MPVIKSLIAAPSGGVNEIRRRPSSRNRPLIWPKPLKLSGHNAHLVAWQRGVAFLFRTVMKLKLAMSMPALETGFGDVAGR